MDLVAVNPAQLPVTLSIGTEGSAYNYRFVDEISMYVCDHQTTTNVPGEVMAIQVAVDPQGTTWYVAQEGELVDGQRFSARQNVFRTTERFWEPGKHEWQLNANSSSTNRDLLNSNWGDTMFALTEVPENVALILVAVGLQRIDAVVVDGDTCVT